MNQAVFSNDAVNDSAHIAALLKAAGDPLRLEILRILSSDSFGVLELSQIFEMKQSGMSHHLKVLSKTGLLTTRREGNSIFYRRSLEPMSAKLDHLRIAIFTAADRIELPAQALQNIEQVYAQRAKASQEFFFANAAQFKQQQDLIAEFKVYGPQIGELLANHPPANSDLALEVGPGGGEFLSELSASFKQVIALDTSEAMLKQAQALEQNQKLSNIEYVNADTRYCQNIPESLDCAVINMVLHHTPSPGQIFADVCGALKSGASLFISDLCAHDQDWVREACGDLWLGFEPSDFSEWAAENQLNEIHSSYIALRNGFQIQIHQYLKQ